MRFRRAAGAIALLVTVTGCTSKPVAPVPGGSAPASVAGSAPPWTEPARYAFVLDRRCGDGPSTGRYRVAVADGEVVTADRIDGRTASGEEEIEVPSLSGLLDLARTAGEDGGEVSTSYDTTDGHPVAVSFNVSGAGPDGAACFVVSDYRPTA